MDSCHIFNFIFGTRKATTELRKCFSNIGENVADAQNKSSSDDRHRQPASSSYAKTEQSPRSPLKQFQSKLSNFVSKVQKYGNEEHVPDPTVAPPDNEPEVVCIQSGTYRATLIRSLSYEQEEEQPDSFDNQETSRIILNPFHEDNVAIFGQLALQHDDQKRYQESEGKQVAIHNEDDSENGKAIQDYNDNISIDINDDKQAIFRAEQGDHCNLESPKNDKRSLYVRNLVRSIEAGTVNSDQSRRSSDNETKGNHATTTESPIATQELIGRRRKTVANVFPISSKPMTLVKPLPPKAPPKGFRARCIKHQLSLNKPTKLQQLFHDEIFLSRFFNSLEPLERCTAAQVCRKWRDVLYSDHKYWKGLINVIDCTQLRREHLVECIINTLQSAKMKQQHKLHEIGSFTTAGRPVKKSNSQQSGSVVTTCFENPPNSITDNELANDDTITGVERKLVSDTIFGFDHEDVWRIQEICNRFALQKLNHSFSKPQTDTYNMTSQANSDQQHQACSASKSSSIPSQISSTFSSASLSSILSPLSESSRVDTMKEKLYTSIDNRGFNAVCLFGATDDDIEDLVSKIPSSSHERITIARLNNCSITNRALDRFITSFHLLSELELTGCNELTNALDLSPLTELKHLIITDCINIADGLAQKLMLILHRLTHLTIQAYHLTDAFIEFLCMNCDTSRIQRLELPNCKEITNQSIIVLAKHFPELEVLSISGSTKISDDGVEILVEQATKLKSLDLSWCPRITDVSLECIACELRNSLTDLVLDRNANVTDIGLGYLSSMSRLSSLQIRWCARITDSGVESLVNLRSLQYLSLAGLHQITARSLLALGGMDLAELELTNCPAVNDDLILFLSTKLPNCNIIF